MGIYNKSVFRLIGDGGVMGSSKTIIVSRTDKIGDFVVSIPSFATLKAMYPDYKIIGLVGRATKILANSLNCIDEVICFDDFDFEVLCQKIQAYKPDAFIALVANWPIMRLAFKSGAPIRIGPWSKPMSFLMFNRGICQHRSRSIKSEAQYNLDLIEHYSPEQYAKTGIHFEQIKFSPQDDQYSLDFLHSVGINYPDDAFILINPLTGGSGCNISLQDYGRVLNSVFAKAPQFNIKDGVVDESEHTSRPLPHVVIMGIPEQSDALYNLLSMIDSQFASHVHLFINTQSLLTAAALVHKCKVFIGPSTGITQIAGNYHKAALCFYSTRLSNTYTRWALFGDNNEVPFTFDVERLDPETKVLKQLTDSTLQAIVSTTLEEFYQIARVSE